VEEDRVYVGDRQNRRIQLFTHEGKFVPKPEADPEKLVGKRVLLKNLVCARSLEAYQEALSAGSPRVPSRSTNREL
jgi:hypothetical protein